jgi:hypothetical protein
VTPLADESRAPNAQHTSCAAHQRENDRVDSHRSGAKHQHNIADRDVAAFHGMQPGRQSASTRHEYFRLCLETNAASAGLEVNLLSPPTAQAIVQAVSDAVNLSFGAASCGFSHQTVPASVTCPVHVKKCDAIAFAKLTTVDIEKLSTNPAQPSD